MKTHDDPTSLASVFADPAVPDRLHAQSPVSWGAAAGYWKAGMSQPLLAPHLKELVLLALHASVTSLNAEAIRRQVQRALDAGATPAQVMDVVLSIVGVSNHALYGAVPVLMDELKAAGHADAGLPELTPEAQALKDEFVATRGFWNEQRDVLARAMPDYFKALSDLSVAPWKDGALTPRERELVYIAIDCSVTHMYEPGLRLHIRNALRLGVARGEILEVFQLAALMGLEGYVIAAGQVFGRAEVSGPSRK